MKTKLHGKEYKQVITVRILSADPYTNPDECSALLNVSNNEI